MKRGDEISVQITDYAFGGRGIAKLETEVISEFEV